MKLVSLLMVFVLLGCTFDIVIPVPTTSTIPKVTTTTIWIPPTTTQPPPTTTTIPTATTTTGFPTTTTTPGASNSIKEEDMKKVLLATMIGCSGCTYQARYYKTPTTLVTPTTTISEIECSGFIRTEKIPITFPTSNEHNNVYATSSILKYGFLAEDALVLEFIAPPADKVLTLAVRPQGGAYGQDIFRNMIISTEACDFIGKHSIYSNYDGAINLVLSSGSSGKLHTSIQLEPEKKYYINIDNYMNGINQCVNKRCDLVVILSNPKPD